MHVGRSQAIDKEAIRWEIELILLLLVMCFVRFSKRYLGR